MSRKLKRVPVQLDARGVEGVAREDLRTILRAADDLIARGGRSLLAQILKGSRRKRVLELGLDQSPVYGEFRGLSETEILGRIDWVILNGYLRIEYEGRLPLLVYSDAGWAIEKDTYAEELLDALEMAAEDETVAFDVNDLKDKERGLIWLLLDKIEAKGNPKVIPLLEAWAMKDYKKVAARIREVIGSLAKPEFQNND